MTDHDPLCPWSEMAGHGVTPPPADECVYCPLIAQVRADERGKSAPIVASRVAAYEQAFVADLRAKVEDELASPREFDQWTDGWNAAKRVVLALFDEVQP